MCTAVATGATLIGGGVSSVTVWTAKIRLVKHQCRIAAVQHFVAEAEVNA
jgi:hypothetical protein